ncbi:MAG: transcriptional regulator [Phycisphaerales bacterium]
MNEHEFQGKLTELLQQIGQMPSPEKEQLLALADDAKERHNKMRRTVSELQESLDYLRLSIKYLVFDLEATRRENQYLRKLLESQAGGSSDAGEPENE